MYLEIALESPQPFTEYNNQAQDGTAYCAMALVRSDVDSELPEN